MLFKGRTRTNMTKQQYHWKGFLYKGIITTKTSFDSFRKLSYGLVPNVYFQNLSHKFGYDSTIRLKIKFVGVHWSSQSNRERLFFQYNSSITLVYIYIYIYIITIKSAENRVPWLSFVLHSYYPLLLAGLLGGILCPRKADGNPCWSANTGMWMGRSL